MLNHLLNNIWTSYLIVREFLSVSVSIVFSSANMKLKDYESFNEFTKWKKCK